MTSNKLMLFMVLLGGMISSIILGGYLVTNATGAVSALVKIVGVGCAALAATRPRLGLNIVFVLGAYIDLLKRLAVYYGKASFFTVVEILLVPMVVLAALVLGAVVRSFLEKGSIGKWEFRLFVAVGLIGGLLLFGQLDAFGLLRGVQKTYGTAGCLLLVPVMLLVIKDYDDLLRCLRFMFWVFLPVAVYGLKQAIWGFTDFEWYYAKTGYTITALEMFSAVPRPFSTLSSVTAMAVMSGFAFFAYWHVLNFRYHRIRYGLAGLVFFAMMIASLSRTSILMFPAAVIAYHLLKTPARTALVYAGGLTALALLIIFADSLLENLDNINYWLASYLPMDSDYSRQAFDVLTFTDRLEGFNKFFLSDRWTLFGVPGDKVSRANHFGRFNSEFHYHDGISEIIINYGVVGFLTLIITVGCILFFLHRQIFRASSRRYLEVMRMSLGFILAFFATTMVTQSIIHQNPVNIFVWTFAGALLYVVRASKQEREAALRAAQPAAPAKVPAKAPVRRGPVRARPVYSGVDLRS